MHKSELYFILIYIYIYINIKFLFGFWEAILGYCHTVTLSHCHAWCEKKMAVEQIKMDDSHRRGMEKAKESFYGFQRSLYL